MSKYKSLIMICISLLVLYCHNAPNKKEKLKVDQNALTASTNHSDKEQKQALNNSDEADADDDNDDTSVADSEKKQTINNINKSLNL